MFGFSLSGSKSSSKTTSSQTSKPINPSWVEPGIQSGFDKVTGLLNQDPGQYVAPANGLLQQAAQGAGALTPNNAAYGSAQGLYQGLMDTGSRAYDPATVKPNSILPNLQAYMDPYLQSVVDSSLAGYDFSSGQKRAQNKLDMANLDDAFGGSGRYITQPLLDSQLELGRTQLESGLRSDAYKTGANLANLDADRRQQAQLANMDAYNRAREFNATSAEQALARQGQAAQGLLGAADAAQGAQTGAINTQAGVGGLLQGIDQAKAEAPLSVLERILGAQGGMSGLLQLLQGQQVDGQTKSKGSTIGGSISGSYGG